VWQGSLGDHAPYLDLISQEESQSARRAQQKEAPERIAERIRNLSGNRRIRTQTKLPGSANNPAMRISGAAPCAIGNPPFVDRWFMSERTLRKRFALRKERSRRIAGIKISSKALESRLERQPARQGHAVFPVPRYPPRVSHPVRLE
jgi:hypothetical protein